MKSFLQFYHLNQSSVNRFLRQIFWCLHFSSIIIYLNNEQQCCQQTTCFINPQPMNQTFIKLNWIFKILAKHFGIARVNNWERKGESLRWKNYATGFAYCDRIVRIIWRCGFREGVVRRLYGVILTHSSSDFRLWIEVTTNCGRTTLFRNFKHISLYRSLLYSFDCFMMIGDLISNYVDECLVVCFVSIASSH